MKKSVEIKGNDFFKFKLSEKVNDLFAVIIIYTVVFAPWLKKIHFEMRHSKSTRMTQCEYNPFTMKNIDPDLDLKF